MAKIIVIGVIIIHTSVWVSLKYGERIYDYIKEIVHEMKENDYE